jgi:hypothetical protein
LPGSRGGISPDPRKIGIEPSRRRIGTINPRGISLWRRSRRGRRKGMKRERKNLPKYKKLKLMLRRQRHLLMLPGQSMSEKKQ